MPTKISRHIWYTEPIGLFMLSESGGIVFVVHYSVILITKWCAFVSRFEMPYNIWCEGCNNHVAMGVRYNAEKSKIGMYYTTPIYKFRMKCHLCDNHFEIKTDPAVRWHNIFTFLYCCTLTII